MIYKNISGFVKKLYGVEFKPDETHEVPGYINLPGFQICDSVPVVEESTTTKKTTTKVTSKTTEGA